MKNCKEFVFSEKKVTVYFDSLFFDLEKIIKKGDAVLLIDENVYSIYSTFFIGWKTIVINSGENFKQQSTIDEVISSLIKIGADKTTSLIGIGGGVVTDIVGYVGSIYMRGVNTGFVPTTLLGMVDACIGGKNGIDVGIYKNMIGTIRQPAFILYDYGFLDSLPEIEWSNGFAEIIKHACIKDQEMFQYLESLSFNYFRENKIALQALIERNVVLKSKIVQSDEFETGERKLLNFGHTIGHSIERMNEISHGHAVSIGMVCATIISEQLTGLKKTERLRLEDLLKKYSLPVCFDFDKEKIIQNINFDKKKSGDDISFVLLNKIGKGQINKIALSELTQLILQLF